MSSESRDGGANPDESRIPELLLAEKNSGWQPRRWRLAWSWPGSCAAHRRGRRATAEDDADAPRSGYRDRMIAAW